jgi:hypothetical protein
MQILRSFLLLGIGMGLSGSLLAQANSVDGPIVVKAKHFHTSGPCIPIGGSLAMPIIDAFQVLKVVKGSLPKSVTTIQVRALSGTLPNVKKGEVNVLRLTRSADTKSQLEDRAKDGYTWLWVNAGELKVEETSK